MWPSESVCILYPQHIHVPRVTDNAVTSLIRRQGVYCIQRTCFFRIFIARHFYRLLEVMFSLQIFNFPQEFVSPKFMNRRITINNVYTGWRSKINLQKKSPHLDEQKESHFPPLQKLVWKIMEIGTICCTATSSSTCV